MDRHERRYYRRDGKVAYIIYVLHKELGRYPTDDEIAARLKEMGL